jgi:hypothetical protein
MITYQPPTPPTTEQEQRIAKSATYLQEQGVLGWATKSLSENKRVDGWTLPQAIAFAKARDTDTMFDTRSDVGGHAAQSAVSAVAACVIRFEPETSAERAWAWDVMERVGSMAEPERSPAPESRGIPCCISLSPSSTTGAPQRRGRIPPSGFSG